MGYNMHRLQHESAAVAICIGCNMHRYATCIGCRINQLQHASVATCVGCNMHRFQYGLVATCISCSRCIDWCRRHGKLTDLRRKCFKRSTPEVFQEPLNESNNVEFLRAGLQVQNTKRIHASYIVRACICRMKYNCLIYGYIFIRRQTE